MTGVQTCALPILPLWAYGYITPPAATSDYSSKCTPARPFACARGGLPTQDVSTRTIAGSTGAFTVPQIHADFGPADWFPGDHPTMPDIVAHGREIEVSEDIEAVIDGHHHDVVSRSGPGGTTVYEVGPAAGILEARRPLRGNLRFIDRQGNPSGSRGVSVGAAQLEVLVPFATRKPRNSPARLRTPVCFRPARRATSPRSSTDCGSNGKRSRSV